MARVVEAKESRVRTERRADGLYLWLPRVRPWWRMLFMAWFAFVFIFGLVSMLTGEAPEDGGGGAFIVVWCLIGITGITTSGWGALHREEVLLDAHHLTHTRSLGPVRRARSYVRTQIEDLRVSQDGQSWFDPRSSFRMQGLTGGVIAFDYGNRTVRLGDLEEAEAKRVVAALEAEGLR